MKITLSSSITVGIFIACCVYPSPCSAQSPAENSKTGSQSLPCLRQMDIVLKAVSLYAMDNDRFPKAETWEAELRPYLPRGFSFGVVGRSGHRIAMNRSMAGKSLKAMTQQRYLRSILFFESIRAKSATRDILSSLPDSQEIMIGYADGHAALENATWVRRLRKEVPFRKVIFGD